jgi:hypothetical protein
MSKNGIHSLFLWSGSIRRPENKKYHGRHIKIIIEKTAFGRLFVL